MGLNTLLKLMSSARHCSQELGPQWKSVVTAMVRFLRMEWPNMLMVTR